MKTPAIQNDFSYYRRTVSRQRMDYNNQMLISTELANRMSLFYAHATPMLKVLSEATSKFVQDNANDVDNTTETIGTMAKVCLRMLEKEWVFGLLSQFKESEYFLSVGNCWIRSSERKHICWCCELWLGLWYFMIMSIPTVLSFDHHTWMLKGAWSYSKLNRQSKLNLYWTPWGIPPNISTKRRLRRT